MTIHHRSFSPGRIGAIASNTLLELVRLKVFYFLLIFALFLIGSSAFMVNFSFQEQFQVLKDVSLGAMSIFSWLLSVLATAMLLPKDVEDRTLYTILAKPVPRHEYVLGKVLGVLLMLLLAIVMMTGVFLIALWSRQQMALADAAHGGTPEDIQAAIATIKASTFTANLIPGIIVIYLKAAIFVTLTLLISTFASSWIFTVIVSTMIYFIGHVQGIAREYWMTSETLTPLKKLFLGTVAVVFPDLQLFNLVDEIVAGNAVHLDMFVKTVGLGCGYMAVYLVLAIFLFSQKEL